MFGENVDNFLSLGYFSGYNASIDPYRVSLEDFLRKIAWTTFFNHSYDFSMRFDKVKRMLNVFGVILIFSSYLGNV